MNRTSIEWVRNPDGSQGYTWNPITGCLNHVGDLCEGGGFPCYAYKLANGRLEPLYLANTNTAYMSKFPDIGYSKLINPFYPRLWEERLDELDHDGQSHDDKRIKGKGIFVCDMGDLFGFGVPVKWTESIMELIGINWKHRFYILTKQAQRLPEFSPFPENCWVGVTATNQLMFDNAYDYLSAIQAKVRYISLEPLLSRIEDLSVLELEPRYVDWLIIGACTGSAWDIGKVIRRYPDLVHKPYGNKWTAQPPIEWVQEIVEAAGKAGIKVFLKDNLRPLLEKQDITDTSFGRLTSLKVEAMKDTQGLPRQRGWYELRQEMPK